MTSKTQSERLYWEANASHGKVNLYESFNRREEDDVHRRSQVDVHWLLCSAEESKLRLSSSGRCARVLSQLKTKRKTLKIWVPILNVPTDFSGYVLMTLVLYLLLCQQYYATGYEGLLKIISQGCWRLSLSMFYQYIIRTYALLIHISIRHDIADGQLSYDASRYNVYCGWRFYRASSCTMLCYHRRCV